ncbi:uncharacterized protein G2W53_010218 [Senna tora]|uniref:Uncharacterized protein n=1 Tax=Senna tora TaxID=362788 RepID=A0A834WZI9_9FABA|nr:uncharacterized protein G2W53_010218 [Senna tora]
MSSGRTRRGRGRGGVRSKTLPYVPLCSSSISQPSSSGNSNGPPQQAVVQHKELQHEIPTGPSQQQGTTGSASIDSSAIIPQGRDPTDGKTWIQPFCFCDWGCAAQAFSVVCFCDCRRIATGKEPSLPELFLKTHMKKDTSEFVDKRSADVIVIEELQQDYRKEIEELKKLTISSRNKEQDQQDDDDEASN